MRAQNNIFANLNLAAEEAHAAAWATYVIGSGLGNPSVHNHVNLPLVVAGGHKGARHIKYPDPAPLANVHLTLLEKAGVHQDKFGDSTGRIEELL